MEGVQPKGKNVQEGVKRELGGVLHSSLKDDTARMRQHKVTGQMNHQTADPKVNASVFLFFPTAHFSKTILASRSNGTFGFARQPDSYRDRPFSK